jgi:hypothetical protein
MASSKHLDFGNHQRLTVVLPIAPIGASAIARNSPIAVELRHWWIACPCCQKGIRLNPTLSDAICIEDEIEQVLPGTPKPLEETNPII